jgi:glycosyltransferase involved in cell wall biosynthesis
MPASNPPLVVLTHEFFPYRGGIAVYVEETARAAVAAGHEVTVFAPDSPELRAVQWPFKIHPVGMRGSLNLRCRLALAKAVRGAHEQLAQSIVWIPEPGALLTAMYLNALGRLPARHLVLTLHGSEILRFAQWPHRRRLFQKLLDRADRVGVVSDFTGDLLQKYFKITATKVLKVSGALRSDFAKKVPLHAIREPGAPLVLLTVGRVHPRKGQHAVLEALAQMNAQPPTALTYHLAGPVVKQDYQHQLESLAKNCGITVHFHGAVPDADLPALYAQADIFILTPEPHGPSVEGFGLVYLEAASAGLPVIAHRIGGVAEAVRDGITGILVNPGDRAGLAAAIHALAGDPQKRAQFAAGAKERVKELSWKKNVAMLFGGIGRL